MNSKLLKRVTLAAGIALASTGVQAETVLKLASVAPTSSPWGQWIQGVAAHIEDISGGKLKIELLLDAQAGDEQTIVRQTVKGRMDIAYVSAVPLTLLAEEMTLTMAPYLWDNADQGTCAAHEHLLDGFSGIMEDAGVKPLGWMEVGHAIIFSKDPVRSPSDLEGVKVRTEHSRAASMIIDTVGGVSVPTGLAEAIPGLQTGLADAMTTAAVYGIAIGTHKVAPHVTVTNHSRVIGTVAVSKVVWDGLSAQEQEWLSSVSSLTPGLTQAILGAENALLGQLAGAGVPVHHLSAEEEAEWREATSGVLDTLVDQVGGRSSEVVDMLMAAKAACSS